MNSLGRFFRVQLHGESHGTQVGVLVAGCPAGIPLSTADFAHDLARRKPQGPASTPRKEQDAPQLQSGIFNGYTTGAPLLITFNNTNVRSDAYAAVRTQPRPGHADLIAQKKYGGYADHRGGGHFSGRLTLPLVAAGVIAKKLLPKEACPQATLQEVAGESDIDKGLHKALQAKDSVGGIVACSCAQLPAALGEPFFDTIEGLLAKAIFAIPAVKGIAFGNGFAATKLFGSQNNDAFTHADGTTATNHAGGVTGGMSNGNVLSFHVAIKPTASTPAPQHSLDTTTGKQHTFTVEGRHDLCIALRVPVVVEAVTACVLADLLWMEQKVPRVFISS